MAVEVGGSEGGDGEGTGFGPVPAGAFEALADELFAGRFDHAAFVEYSADLPAACLGGGVVHVVLLVGHIRQQLVDGFARAASAWRELRPQPLDQRHTAAVVQLGEGLVGPCGGQNLGETIFAAFQTCSLA